MALDTKQEMFNGLLELIKSCGQESVDVLYRVGLSSIAISPGESALKNAGYPHYDSESTFIALSLPSELLHRITKINGPSSIDVILDTQTRAVENLNDFFNSKLMRKFGAAAFAVESNVTYLIPSPLRLSGTESFAATLAIVTVEINRAYGINQGGIASKSSSLINLPAGEYAHNVKLVASELRKRQPEDKLAVTLCDYVSGYVVPALTKR